VVICASTHTDRQHAVVETAIPKCAHTGAHTDAGVAEVHKVVEVHRVVSVVPAMTTESVNVVHQNARTCAHELSILLVVAGRRAKSNCIGAVAKGVDTASRSVRLFASTARDEPHAHIWNCHWAEQLCHFAQQRVCRPGI
jgi:hypothetical protein